jgi:hypothetical protein
MRLAIDYNTRKIYKDLWYNLVLLEHVLVPKPKNFENSNIVTDLNDFGGVG